MKTKAIVTVVILSASNMIWANGGQSVDNIDLRNITPTKAEFTEIKVQGPVDQFNVKVDSSEKTDTSSLLQSYNGKS